MTMAALQADQGLARSIWMSVGDIMWLAWSFPNTSSHTFTLSCGMLNTWPVGRGKETQWAVQLEGMVGAVRRTSRGS